MARLPAPLSPRSRPRRPSAARPARSAPAPGRRRRPPAPGWGRTRAGSRAPAGRGGRRGARRAPGRASRAPAGGGAGRAGRGRSISAWASPGVEVDQADPGVGPVGGGDGQRGGQGGLADAALRGGERDDLHGVPPERVGFGPRGRAFAQSPVRPAARSCATASWLALLRGCSQYDAMLFVHRPM